MPLKHPQPKKGIRVLNIIVQCLFKKTRCEKKEPQRNTQNPNAPNNGIET